MAACFDARHCFFALSTLITADKNDRLTGSLNKAMNVVNFTVNLPD